ncbi:hypothetical protein AWB90_19340 [Mycobacterium paraense]|uniref:Uncharacterized protein n=1 Tax=Mycobacterium paraense TaxID=767916 RepID=A0A1X2A7P2_9MYCO|nr:hypothetical protein [Mycobacterium paraense]ORW43279.1 hypothetical protein AWB90_19340 [Mycobacterium paraense]
MSTPPMNDDLVLHQIHGMKLAADVTAEVVSLPLLWTGHRRLGLAVHFLIPVIGSAALLRADLTGLRATRRGNYVLRHMPPTAQAVRLAGDAVMTVGALRRDARAIAAGALIVIAGWSHGLIVRTPAATHAV